MSKIEWTDETWNVVTGCTRISPGCDNCYMFALYPRLKAMGVQAYQHAPDVVALHPGRLWAWRSWRKPRLVFVNSMSDTFNQAVPDEFLRWMFQQMRMAIAEGHTFQVLTKRPGRALQFWERYQGDFLNDTGEPEWPLSIWLGTSSNRSVTPPAGWLPWPGSPRRCASSAQSLSWGRWISGGGWVTWCSG